MAGRGSVIAEVEVSGLTLTLGGRSVLTDLDLIVNSGSICAVVGESGSGKTSLLRTIAGFIEPDYGSIQFDGKHQQGIAPQDRAAALLFQEPRLFPALSVEDNVSFGLRVRGVSAEERSTRAAALLTSVGLDDRGADRIDGLSGGEQQRVSLARALCVQPDVLLLDEPFSAVDAPRRSALRALIAELQRRHGTTMLLVTHDVADAQALADTVAVLVDGAIAQHGAVDEVVASPTSATVAGLLRVDTA